MPAGSTEIGIAAFVGVKLVGYTVAGIALRRAYERTGPVPIAFGVSRTLLGIAVGMAYGATAAASLTGLGVIAAYAGLLPVRLLEWFAMIAAFFDRRLTQPGRLLKYSFLGSAWSYFLDVAAAATALITPGGVWIC